MSNDLRKYIDKVYLIPSKHNQLRSTIDNYEVHLTQAQIDEIGVKLDALYKRVRDSLGERERKYIFRTMRVRVLCELFGRAIIGFSRKGASQVFGSSVLGVAKIIDNMEIGHNVMHGQYDWMGEQTFKGKEFEWDNVCPSDQWRHSHNALHHKNTNIRGLDKDLGFNTLRIDRYKKWRPYYLGNTLYAFLMMVFFEWGVMLHDATISDFYTGRRPWKELIPFATQWWHKASRQVFKDFIFFPLLAGKRVKNVIKSNFIANIIRNVWTHAIIFCGHFPTQAQTFSKKETAYESRGQWYIRQMLGSCNIYGSDLFHFFTGNLSFQIEHHLFPDIPANRYKEISSEVQALCQEYGLPYNNGRFTQQIGSVWWKLAKFSLPNRFTKPEKEIRIIIDPDIPIDTVA